MAYASLSVYGAFRRLHSASSSSIRGRRLISVNCSAPSDSPPSPRLTASSIDRRSASLTLLLLHCCSAPLERANAGSIFDKYVKRKKLDPLEAYVPAVLLTQAQFKDLERSLDVEQPNYGISRSLLRFGPAASLRVNIRAVAQYAAEDGKGKAASDAVDRCLRALEDLDSLMLHASRNDPAVTVQSMKSKINVVLESLDSLLQTVPSPVLDKGKAVADAYRVPEAEGEQRKAEELDPDLKELEAIL